MKERFLNRKKKTSINSSLQEYLDLGGFILCEAMPGSRASDIWRPVERTVAIQIAHRVTIEEFTI